MTSRILVSTALILLLMSVAASAVPGAYTEYNETTANNTGAAFATKADVMLHTIKNLVEAKEYLKAEELAQEVTDGSPDMVDGWMMLGYTRSLNAKYDLSNEAYEKALEFGADTKQVLLRKVYNCRRLNDTESVRACFEQILDIEEDVDVLMQFGNFEKSMRNYDDARQHFKAVLDVQPERLAAVKAMSQIEEELGHAAEVKYWLKTGVSLEPENKEFLSRLSLLYLNEQNYDLSIHYLNVLLSIEPDDPGAYRNLGIAHFQRGEKQLAKEAFEKVRELGGKMKGLYGPLADCYRSTGAHGEALAVIIEGIGNNEQQAWLYSLWGKLLEDQSRYDDAIGKFDKAVKLNSEPWSGYARKQISRQTELKKRAELIAQQNKS